MIRILCILLLLSNFKQKDVIFLCPTDDKRDSSSGDK